jgi:hypothetical protein
MCAIIVRDGTRGRARRATITRDMGRIQHHLRKTFLAGIFAAVPVAVTCFIIWYIDNRTRWISQHCFTWTCPSSAC